MGGDGRKPGGYVIQLYQYALRYKYNNKQFVDYFNEISSSPNNENDKGAPYIVLGDFDRIEINEVYFFRQYHDVSQYAKNWVGKRQCMLLYDVSKKDEKEYSTRLCYKKDYPVNKSSNGWVSDYYSSTEKRFFCLSMLSLTNDVVNRCNDIGQLIYDLRKKILSIVDQVNKQESTEVLCEVFGTFNTSEIAITWLCDEYVDILHVMEHIKHISITDINGYAYNAFLTTFSVISIPSRMPLDNGGDIRGNALVQLSVSEERSDFVKLNSFRQQLQDRITELSASRGKQDKVEFDFSVGEYDWVIKCPASAIITVLNPKQPFNGLHYGIRATDGSGQYTIDLGDVLRKNTRLLIGDNINGELLQKLEELITKGEFVVNAPYLLDVGKEKTSDPLILTANRERYYKPDGIREELKKCVNSSTGLVDTMDLLITDYQSVISTAYSRVWAEDMHIQFQAVLRLIETLIRNKDCDLFWDHYRDLTNAFKQQVYHLTQASRMFFEIPSSHLRATGQYDFLMHAYYGISKEIIELVYYMQHEDPQSELVPLLTVNTEPQVKSELFYLFDKDGVRTMNLIIPNSVLTDPYRGIVYLSHEFFHYAVPKSRTDRNRRFGLFLIERIFRYQVFIIIQKMMLDNCPSDIYNQVKRYVDYESSDDDFSKLFLGGFDGYLLELLDQECIYKLVEGSISLTVSESPSNVLRDVYEKAIMNFAPHADSDDAFLSVFKNVIVFYLSSVQEAIHCLPFEKKEEINSDGSDSDKRKEIERSYVERERALAWIESRLMYHSSVQDSVLKAKVSAIRMAEQKNSHALFDDQKTLYRGVMEAYSDIAAVSLTGMKLADYALFFIQNLCDIKRENNPDVIDLVQEESTSLRFYLVVMFWYVNHGGETCDILDIQDTVSSLIDGEYFSNMFTWTFIRHKEKGDLPLTVRQEIINGLKGDAKKWIHKLDQIVYDVGTKGFSVYYHDIFAPILINANVIFRQDELLQENDSRLKSIGRGIQKILKKFRKVYEKYSVLRESLDIKNLDSVHQYSEELFALDISTIQSFQYQKSLYLLEGINERVIGQHKEINENSKPNASTNSEHRLTSFYTNLPEQSIKTEFRVYDWEELQYYTKYCQECFQKDSDYSTGYEKPFSQIWYRGHTSVNYLLEPTLFRTLKNLKKNGKLPNKEDVICYSQRVQLEYFKTLIDGAPEIPFYGSFSDVDYCALMQHYGLDSNLLDFTENMFVSLYLALKYFSDEELIDDEDKAKKKQRDVVLYLFNPAVYNDYRNVQLDRRSISVGEGDVERNKRILGLETLEQRGIIPNLSISYNKKLYDRFIFGNEELDKICVDKTYRNSLPVAVWTPRLNHRIETQSGSFVAFDMYSDLDEYKTLDVLQEEYLANGGEHLKPFLYKIVIDKSCCEDIYYSMKRMGITRKFVYPEIEQVKYRFKNVK